MTLALNLKSNLFTFSLKIFGRQTREGSFFVVDSIKMKCVKIRFYIRLVVLRTSNDNTLCGTGRVKQFMNEMVVRLWERRVRDVKHCQ